ncbi:uncharacterized protein LOC143430385 isoform X2 [Xylocopa sonorina]|uniref:uncharacterized protein LOC143430385 isoform X2 n=1 Tax=Xylocopa sonorina TaxID=1818115 RepID=UPI00403AA7A0
MSLVVAGVASGICFLIYSGIFKGKSGGSKEDEKQVHVDENHCACCLRPFHLGRGVRCKDCGARSCRKGCSRWDASDKAWHCLFCRQQSYWLKQKEVEVRGGSLNKKDLHRYFSTAKARVYVAGVENATTSSGQSLAAEREEANTMETIRDFVERIVEGLIGNMDDTPINRLYDHPAYDKVSEKHIVSLVDALTRLATVLHLCIKNKPNANTPSMAHTTLREVVERVVDEARKLPGLGGSGGTGRVQEGCNIAEHSYEDLLATAILNKVIEKFQKERMDGNSNVLTGKPVSTTKCSLSENEAILDEGVEEGCSSLEPLSQDDCSSDCSASCLRRVRNQPEPLSLTIEERIEEVTTTYASDEEPKENDVLAIRNTHRVPFPELGMDVIDLWQESEDSQDELDITKIHIDMVSPVESWEENWLFQKKRVQTQADPVAMLVPNPSADFKALIGDKDAEDTSDLSECSSAQSDEEIEKELEEAINNVVPRSPKGSEFENGLDHYRQPSDDVLYEENSVNTTSRNVDTPGSKAGERTNWKLVRGQSETKMKDEKTAVDCVRSQSLKENGHDEYRGVEMNFERFEIGDERSVQKSIKAIREDLKKVEMERQMTNEMPKENKTEHSTGNEDPLKMDRSEFVAENSSSFTDLRSSTVCSTRENDPDVPKTPTSTPTCCSVPEISLGNPNDEETNVLRVENVLNSLERAKKKLMEDNDDTVEVFEDEEARTARQKVDFHAEDIQQESEYTEHYDIATQRHLDSLTKSETFESTLEKESSMEDEGSKCREAVASAKAESASHPSLRRKNSEEDVRFSTPPRPGTIAEREHRKWENAPPIENNPYSQENIQKRLWERQYSRRSSDIPGINSELPKSNGADLDVVLTPHEPDIRRFSRDYYINDSKATGSEKGRRSAASTSSRPSSSLSQGSSSTGMADQDQQDETQYRETESLLNRSNDVKSKVARWQNNIVESKYQTTVRQDDVTNETEKGKEKFAKKIECQRTWEEQRMEEMLENERKNSKNEINAKLNNQENYENAVIETRRSNSDDNPRKIKRIDLKAYGFENEFSSNKTIKTSTPRVVNKLDLKSFGYDDGIRRTQSNIQLNSIGSDEFKPRFIGVANKSNLTRCNDYESDDCNVVEGTRTSGDNNVTQSTEALHKFEGYNDFGMKAAKSVPNITKFYSNMSNHGDEEPENYNQNSYNELEVIKNGSVKNIANNYNLEKCNIKSSESSIDESENDTDNSSERGQTQQPLSNGKKKTSSDEEFDNKVLSMPSVRRLAEAFSKQTEHVSAPISKVKSSNVHKERSSTPEIQIVETPRQMHSLTARSLSKQFREGLRQIPNKMTSPPASHVTMEQPNIPENQTEVVQSKNDNALDDTSVILSGKLKSNIIFWEQMQKKS